MTGAIITLPLIAFCLCFYFSKPKVNKEPKIVSFRQSPELKGNPKQIGQPLGISSTAKPNVKFKHHSEWWAYIRNERNALNS